MAMHFDRWEKDPFFSAAEEVQESADRMESSYRTWIHAVKDTSYRWNLEELQRDLRAALGTAKWQLEEFERAVKASYKKHSADEAIDRHHQFILAMEEKVSVVENMWQEISTSDSKTQTQWVRLDEGERDEFALFLAGPTVSNEKLDIRVVRDGDELANPYRSAKPENSTLKNKSYASGLHLIEGKYVKSPGHRRTASASADISSWDISVYDDENKRDSTKTWAEPRPRRVPSYSGLISAAMESTPKLILPKNCFRKWKAGEQLQDDDIALLRPQQPSQGMSACCEKSKSCLNTGDDCCNKQLYGWYGAAQRMWQRSQYQVQYSRPVQLTFWTALLLLSIVLFVLRAI
ncbi:uncharacterized protein LOC130810522 isoform X1 [Amaranthus tricolor]|uniref:uncharacterized protein LOC130810522 isoform X1 n=1 Tax=Amaranthus tricolor TaxID=29722 RepID=UPI0025899770|nr:uncharacterized protein LOC130810522 isoform X1 [Amaranthus tricolor]